MRGGRFFPTLPLLLLLAAGALALAAAGCGGSDPEDTSSTRILWTFQTAASVYYASPALSADGGTVYVGTSNTQAAVFDEEHVFYALSAADGSLRWSFPLDHRQMRSAPAVTPDGSISFLVEGPGSSQGSAVQDELLRLRPDGSLAWSAVVNPAPGMPEIGLSSPAVGPDGTVYIASSALFAYRPSGEFKWSRSWSTGEDLRASPVIGADGTVYFVSHNVPLTALDPADGSIRWSLDLGINDHVFSSPAIAADGKILVATNQGLVWAVTPAGTVAWVFSLVSTGYDGTFRSSPAVGADGSIYLGTNQGMPAPVFLALHGDGTLKWIFEPSDLPADVPVDHFDIYSSPALGSDGIVYFGQEFGRVYALRAEDGSLLWMVPVRQGITWSSPALAADGKLFIGDLSGRIYAIQTGSLGLDPAAPWAKYRRDARNSGCVAPG